MSFDSLIRILWARRWLTVLLLVACVGTTVTVTLMLPKQYTATTELILGGKVQDRMTGELLPARSGSSYMATQVEVIKSRKVAARVYDRLPSDMQDIAERQAFLNQVGEPDPQRWVMRTLGRNLRVTPSRDGSVLAISLQSEDPKLAAALVNAVAEAYTETQLELRTDPALRFSQWYDQQLDVLRQNLRDARRKLSSYQQEHGIIALDERLDVETERLRELSSMLVAAQGESLQDQLKDSQGERAGTIAHVPDNTVIQNLRSELARAEAALKDMSTRYGINHPEYQRASSEVEALRASLNREMKLVAQTLRSNAEISEGRTRELEAALARQKERVLELNAHRDELELLRQEVATAQEAYDAASGRASANRLESRLGETEVTVLNEAVPPVLPSSPNLQLNLVISTALGLLLGFGVSLLLEMTHRRIRSRADIEEGLGLPVLAYLPASSGRWRHKEANSL